jgi:hypothetical protein
MFNKEFQNGQYVELADYSGYDPRFSCNGGAYAYFRRYTYDGEKFVVSYDSTSEMGYCQITGHHCQRCQGAWCPYGDGEYRRLTAEEAEAEVASLQEKGWEFLGWGNSAKTETPKVDAAFVAELLGVE